ncbi:hypothetical protein HDU77_011046 [Chytriomyces hyalinus]|nr:hypothetical protein HDU77_011046 [Chytriomyces hyalinus]
MKRKRTEKRKGKVAASDTASQAPPVSTAETITAPSETNALAIILHTLENMQAAMSTIQTDVAAIKGTQQRLSNQVHELQNRHKKFFTRLKDLPLEVIAQIFSWIPFYSVLKLGGLWLMLPQSYQTAVAKAAAAEIKIIVGGTFKYTKKKLPESIARLTAVERISLDYCALTGSIPDVFGTLKNLTNLILRGNNLTGPLPSSFSLLSGLRFLDVSNNQLSGEFPALPNSNDLDALSVQNNRFTGPIPTVFGKPIKLGMPYGWHNCFNIIPATITQLTKLEHLLISNNPFSSKILAQLWNLPSLITLDMSSCKLFGSLAGVGALLPLEVLDVSKNQLSGEFPSSEFYSLEHLRELHFMRNEFSACEGKVLFVEQMPKLTSMCMGDAFRRKYLVGSCHYCYHGTENSNDSDSDDSDDSEPEPLPQPKSESELESESSESEPESESDSESETESQSESESESEDSDSDSDSESESEDSDF